MDLGTNSVAGKVVVISRASSGLEGFQSGLRPLPRRLSRSRANSGKEHNGSGGRYTTHDRPRRTIVVLSLSLILGF